MTVLNANPSTIPITADDDYEVPFTCLPRRRVTLEVVGERDGCGVQPCIISPLGEFIPVAEAAVADGAPMAWEIRTGQAGKVGVRVTNATGDTSLLVEVGEIPPGQ